MAGIDNIDIFGDTRSMLANQYKPDAQEIINEPMMYGMPSGNISESMRYADGSTEDVSMTGTRGIDGVFLQVLQSPEISSILRVTDIPPETLAESKEIFDYLVREKGVGEAYDYLKNEFGRYPTNLAPQSAYPGRQKVEGMNEAYISSGVNPENRASFMRRFANGGGVDSIDIFDDPNRDPYYEELGLNFDPDRGQYFEVIEHPEYGMMRSYVSPRDKSTVPELSEARIEDDMRGLAALDPRGHKRKSEMAFRMRGKKGGRSMKGAMTDLERSFFESNMRRPD